MPKGPRARAPNRRPHSRGPSPHPHSSSAGRPRKEAWARAVSVCGSEFQAWPLCHRHLPGCSPWATVSPADSLPPPPTAVFLPEERKYRGGGPQNNRGSQSTDSQSTHSSAPQCADGETEALRPVRTQVTGEQSSARPPGHTCVCVGGRWSLRLLQGPPSAPEVSPHQMRPSCGPLTWPGQITKGPPTSLN